MASIFTAYSPLLPDLSNNRAATYCRRSFVSSLALQASACRKKNESLRAEKHYLMVL